MTESNIKPIGTLLKEKRQELNLSLREAETATSIRMNQLQAIENGEMKALISPVYARGFVKQYAKFLGMDGEALVKEYRDLFAQNPKAEFSYGIGTLESRSHLSSGVSWLPNVIWLAAFGALLGAAWFVATYFEIL